MVFMMHNRGELSMINDALTAFIAGIKWARIYGPRSGYLFMILAWNLTRLARKFDKSPGKSTT